MFGLLLEFQGFHLHGLGLGLVVCFSTSHQQEEVVSRFGLEGTGAGTSPGVPRQLWNREPLVRRGGEGVAVLLWLAGDRACRAVASGSSSVVLDNHCYRIITKVIYTPFSELGVSSGIC